MDARHVLIILSSTSDANRDFKRNKEPTTTTSWIKLPGLSVELFNAGYIEAIVSHIGHFVAIDEGTRSCRNPSYGRACVEIDLQRPVPGEIWLHGHQLSSCRKAKKSVGPGGGARLGGEKQQVGITAADQGSDPKFQEVVPQNQIEDLDNQLAQDQSNKSRATNHREEDSEGWIRVLNQKSLEPKSNTQKKADAVGVSVDIITPEADVSVEHPVRRALKGTKEKLV
ncbi:hypothetical protein QQ045_000110 [Rhodiola kirilowii]